MHGLQHENLGNKQQRHRQDFERPTKTVRNSTCSEDQQLGNTPSDRVRPAGCLAHGKHGHNSTPRASLHVKKGLRTKRRQDMYQQ